MSGPTSKERENTNHVAVIVDADARCVVVPHLVLELGVGVEVAEHLEFELNNKD